MNRTTSLFLAIGILMVHSLAMHQTDTGGFAGALDEAHVAFRVARQLFRDGVASWNTGTPSFDAYPSLLWILVAWIPERLYRDPARFCQVLGLLSALATSIVVSRFSRERLAGIIAPLLLAFSGAFAAAATSGTEAAALALLMTSCFLSMERRRPRLLALGLLATSITRPDGAYFALAVAVIACIRERRSPSEVSRSMYLAVIPALVATGLIALMRHSMNGNWFSPTTLAFAEVDTERAALGWSYLSDFLLKSGSAFLILFPLAAMFRRKLSETALRGMALIVVWFVMVVWSGGNGLPFWLAMAPILPIFFVTIQEGMAAAIDTERAGIPATTWVAFILALGLSAMVTKKPGNIGSIELMDAHFEALEASPRVSAAYERIHGRESERVAIRTSNRLREIGNFLRKELDHNQNVLTPWPGSIGYHSRRRIDDLLGRTTLAPGKNQLNAWSGNTKIDLVAQIAEMPDHLLLNTRPLADLPNPHEIVGNWLSTWDIVGDTPERRAEITELLINYTMLTIPIQYQAGDAVLGRLDPFVLLQSNQAGKDPWLEIKTRREGKIRVIAHNSGHALLADLEVRAIDEAGKRWFLRPTGEFTDEPEILARPELLLFKTRNRALELIEFSIPRSLNAVRVVASLRNPGAGTAVFFANLGRPVQLELGAVQKR